MNDPQNATTERRAAWIGKAVRVEGKVISAGDLTIDGDVDGAIEVGEHDLTIGHEASVKADLKGRVITISGNVTGNVQAVEKVDLRSSGSVQGNIATPRFSMADGANVTGKVNAGKPKT